MSYITAGDIYESNIRKVADSDLDYDNVEKYEVLPMLANFFESYLEEKGKSVEDTVRDYEKTENGFSFTCGSGYDTISVDILGDGTGKSKREFEDYIEKAVNIDFENKKDEMEI